MLFLLLVYLIKRQTISEKKKISIKIPDIVPDCLSIAAHAWASANHWNKTFFQFNLQKSVKVDSELRSTSSTTLSEFLSSILSSKDLNENSPFSDAWDFPL